LTIARAMAGCAPTMSAIFGHVDVHADVAVHRHLAQLGDQPGVVLRGEERGVDAEHLGDAQQHRDRQWADVGARSG